MPTSAVKYIVTAALRSPSADNSQPWHFTWDGTFLTVTYDSARVSGLTFEPGDPATLLSMGGVIENLNRAADQLELHVHREEISDSELISGSYYRIRIKPEERAKTSYSLCDLPLFHRHTNRFSFKNNQLDDDLAASIRAECELNARTSLITDPKNIHAIANLVRNASEIRFQTKEVHEWLGKSLRFSAKEVEYGDGLDVATLDLPLGGGLFLKFISDWGRMALLNRFRAFKILAMIDSAPVSKAPALLTITCPAGSNQVIAAGRLLTRVWTRLNENGIAVHPYYVIPDQLWRLKQKRIPDHLLAQARSMEHEASHIFGLDKSHTELQMLLRIGYPKKKPVLSKRLPLNDVFTDISNR